MDKITGNVIGEVEVKLGKLDNNYVMLPVIMFAYESDKYVSDDEFAVYYEIVYHAHIRDSLTSHITGKQISNRLQSWGDSHKSRGGTRAVKAIKSLEAKGYIKIDSHGIEKIKPLTPLTIRIQSSVFKDEIKCGKTKYAGFVQIKENFMDIAKRDIKYVGRRLKILSYTLWREGVKKNSPSGYEYRIPFSEWEDVLKLNRKHAVPFVHAMEDEGVINIKHGVFYTNDSGEVRQETNQYSVNDEPKEVEDDDGSYKPTVTQRHNRDVAIAELLLATTDSRMNDRPELFIRGDLAPEDMYIYKTTECLIVKEWGKKRFDAISKSSEGGKRMVDGWEALAEKRIKEESQLQPEYVDVEFKVETKVKMNPTSVDYSIPEYVNIEQDDDYSQRFRKAQEARQSRDAEESRKREEEDNWWEFDEDEAV